MIDSSSSWTQVYLGDEELSWEVSKGVGSEGVVDMVSLESTVVGM